MSTPAIRLLQPSQLGYPGSLEATVDVVLGQKFGIFYMYVEPLVAEAMKWQPSNEDIRNILAVAYEKRQLTICVTDTARDDHLQLELELGWKNSPDNQPTNQFIVTWVMRPSGALFTKNKLDPEYYAQRLIELGKQLYYVLRPSYGWIERCRPRGYTKDNDVQALAVPHIYWANFFSPAYVERLGGEFLTTVPVGRTEELEDGGVLYVLRSRISPSRLTKVEEESIKRYFGVEFIRCKTK